MSSSATKTNNDSTEAQTKLVERILSAETLYEVLAVDPNTLNPSSLRKAYLTTSVKVHPDKNPHPEATAAFQRVAEAWTTLSDDSARAAYNAELRNPTRPPGGQQQQQHHQQGGGAQFYAYDFERTHMPSFQEALFMFAAATSMFAGSSARAGGAGTGGGAGSALNVASDFMETIFWAQKLADGRAKETNNHNMDPNDPNFHSHRSTGTGADEPSGGVGVGQTAANNPMASGMAMGSGLRAVAATQRMMGFNKGAAATEKAARTVQMAAMGATVLKAANEVPAVKRTLERGKDAFQNNPQIGRGLRASLKFAGNLVQTLQEAQKEQQQQQQQQQNGNYTNNGNPGGANNFYSNNNNHR